MSTLEEIKKRISKIQIEEPNDLVLCKMTHEEAKLFAGEYGMNAIIIDYDEHMDLVRINNSGDGSLHAIFNSPYGPHEIQLTDDYTIYWIGGKQ